MKKSVLWIVLLAFILVGSLVCAQAPVRNVSPKLHPNLAEAQELCFQAYQKIEAAQKANKGDMVGHAQRAKELLEQVNSELKLAAEAANANKGR